LRRPTDELRFTYQGVKQLTRPTGKPKFRYQGINTLIRPTDKPKVEGIIITKPMSIGHQWEHRPPERFNEA
jgi:hypothetical protein